MHHKRVEQSRGRCEWSEDLGIYRTGWEILPIALLNTINRTALGTMLLILGQTEADPRLYIYLVVVLWSNVKNCVRLFAKEIALIWVVNRA